jgi:hypothetical protein
MRGEGVMLRSHSPHVLLVLSVAMLNPLSVNAIAQPDGSSVAATPQALCMSLPDGARDGAGTASFELLLSDLGPAVVRIGANGWIVRIYSEGAFELRPILPPAGGTAENSIGDVCETGRVLLLRTRTNESLGAGTLSADLMLASGGPLGTAGESAAISGTWSPAPTPVPYGPHLYWQAARMSDVVSTEARSWGSIKDAFR